MWRTRDRTSRAEPRLCGNEPAPCRQDGRRSLSRQPELGAADTPQCADPATLLGRGVPAKRSGKNGQYLAQGVGNTPALTKSLPLTGRQPAGTEQLAGDQHRYATLDTMGDLHSKPGRPRSAHKSCSIYRGENWIISFTKSSCARSHKQLS